MLFKRWMTSDQGTELQGTDGYYQNATKSQRLIKICKLYKIFYIKYKNIRWFLFSSVLSSNAANI